jgi:O-antigen ligase
MTFPGQADAPRNANAPGWLWFAVLVAALALLGGSARPDPVQNVVLRPLAALLLIPALARLRGADLAGLRVPLIMGGTLLVWMTVQLVPLPPSLWKALPGRDLVAGLDRLAGVDGVWRPIALVPFRALDSLLAMLVPVVALLLALATRLRTRTMLLAIAGLGAGNAVLGILQVIGGSRSPFHLYALTNRGAATGLFANENHAAVFAAVALLVLARLALAARTEPSESLPARARLALLPLYLLVLLGALVSGSRAGLACAVLAMLTGGLMLWSRWCAHHDPAKGGDPRALALAGAGGLAIVILVSTFLFFGRAPAAADLLADRTIEDIRWSLLPVLGEMLRDHWLAGTGFGSFEAIYRIYEPAALLLPAYVNQAHNDWAQLLIEGGLPAALCLFGLLGWTGAAILALARRAGLRPDAAVMFWTAWLAILMAASVVDYPLRTPTFQAVSVWLLFCLARDRAQSAGTGSVRLDVRRID